jgi:ATP-dependent DNA ligase
MSDNLEKIEEVKETLSNLKDFTVIPDFLSVSGSSVYGEKSPDDIDCVLRCGLEDGKLVVHLDEGILMKIRRALERNTGKSTHFVPSKSGPNWDYIPFADLKIVPKSEMEVRDVGDKEDLAKSESLVEEATESSEENSVKPGRFFWPMKPVRAAKVEERMTISYLVSLFTEEDLEDGVFVEKKYDGVHVVAMKDGGTVKLVTDDGTDVTSRFPYNVKALEKLTYKGESIKSFSMTVEVETWEGDRRLPREETSGYIRSNSDPDESGVVFNAVALTFLMGKDIHEEPFTSRRDRLESFDFQQSVVGVPDPGFNLAPSYEVHSEEELRYKCEDLSNKPGSEGVVAKKANSPYSLSGDSSDSWVKFHKNILVTGVVIQRTETESGDVWNYEYGILSENPATPSEVNGNVYEKVGTTFSTDIRIDEGDKIDVEVEGVRVDVKEGKEDITVWVPRVIGKSDEKIDSADDVISRAEEVGIISVEQVSKSDRWPKDPHTSYILQNHWRGRSVHGDLRIKWGNVLHGWTLMYQSDDEVDEPVTDLETAKDRRTNDDLYKIDIRTGEFDGSIRCAPKKDEPMEWFDVEGVSSPGEVGATKEYPAVFDIIDKGDVSVGAQKPYFEEYFFDGDVLKGRYVFRQVARKEAIGMGVGGQRQGTDRCYCPSCGNSIPHDRGTPCMEISCSECGSPMTGVDLDYSEKVYLEEWRDRGTTDPMDNPADNWQVLFHELQILGNSAWPKIKKGEKWGDWAAEDVKKYFADVVDSLRSVYFPLIPPDEKDDSYNTSYWDLYRKSRQYMNSKPPSMKEIPNWKDLRQEEISKQQTTLPAEEEHRTPFYWIMMDVKNQTPYVLNKQSADDWVPPKGYSCLPKEIEDEIKSNLSPKYHYWRMEKEEDRRESRDMLVKDIELHEIGVPETKSVDVAKSSAEYKLIHRWWKGQFVVRFGPSTELWDFIIKDGENFYHWEVAGDPRSDEFTANLVDDSRVTDQLWSIDGYTRIAPSTEANPTKDTPAWAEIEGRGSVEIVEDSETEKKYSIDDDVIWFMQESPGSEMWVAGSGEDMKSEKFSMEFDIAFKSEEEQVVGGIVYEPLKYDTDGDWSDENVIRDAMYYFMENGLSFSVGHEKPFNATVLESFQAEKDTMKGGAVVPEGSWYMLLRINDDWVWEMIKNKELNGFSWEGSVFRQRNSQIT